jgi:uncharacterized membrane protein
MKTTVEDQHLQKVVSMTLRSGVTTASVVSAIGGLLFLIANGRQTVDFHTFAGTNSPFTSLASITHALFGSDAAASKLAIVQVGVLILLLTPVLRVALSIVGFAMEKDHTYVLITAIVLMTLMCSIILH